MTRLPAALALLLTVLASNLIGLSPVASAAQPKPKTPPPRTALMIFENHDYSEIVGSPEMPFLNGLAPRGTLFTNYNGVARPSLPNYLALIGGSTYGINTDCTECAASGTNLGVQLSEAGISWRAYMEDLPAPCFTGPTSGSYAKKHDPFMYFESISANPTLCQNVVPAGSVLEADLKSRKGLPTFSWITPNMCNDAHDCGLGTADAWLATWVPRVLPKLGPNGVLIIVFDESTPGGSPSGGHIPALFLGPGARKGLQLSGFFNHYSLLATIESRYHLPRVNESAAATTMKGAFAPIKHKKPRKHRRHKHSKH